jgi:hypothetical protein
MTSLQILSTMHSPINRRAANCSSPHSVVALWLAMFGGGVLLTQSGCTTLLSAGGLQEAFQDTGDMPAMATYDTASDGEVVSDDDGESSTAAAKPVDPAAAEAALDSALEKLAAAGRLTSATERALSEAVEDAPPQDWPDIIDAFVSTIESTPAPQRMAMRPIDAPAATPPHPDESSQPPMSDDAVASSETAPAHQQADHPEPVAAAVSEAAADADPVATTEATTPAVSQPVPHLSVVNPCFASRVRGWGAVDRFDSSRFHPGQELIIYFELEDLTGDESTEGHTTRIDTTLQLFADDGRRLHEWRFEPLQETCRAPRRDYFARYVVRIPEGMPVGACRLDLAVTDAVAHTTAHASLPLEIAGRVQ